MLRLLPSVLAVVSLVLGGCAASPRARDPLAAQASSPRSEERVGSAPALTPTPLAGIFHYLPSRTADDAAEAWASRVDRLAPGCPFLNVRRSSNEVVADVGPCPSAGGSLRAIFVKPMDADESVRLRISLDLDHFWQRGADPRSGSWQLELRDFDPHFIGPALWEDAPKSPPPSEAPVYAYHSSSTSPRRTGGGGGGKGGALLLPFYAIGVLQSAASSMKSP